MSDSGFEAVRDDLRTASSNVSHAVDGMGGFTLESSGMSAYGHGGLHATVLDFCSTIQHSVQTFHQDASAAGDALTAAAGAYVDSDDSAAQTIGLLGGEL